MSLNKAAFCVVACLLLAACSSLEGVKNFFGMETYLTQGPEHKVAERRICVKNFSVADLKDKGSYYRSHQYFKGATKQGVIRNSILYLLSLGWSIKNVDTDLGVISAIPDVTYGDNSQASLAVLFNAIVTEDRSGLVRVEGNFFAVAGQNILADDAREEICAFLQAATGGSAQ